MAVPASKANDRCTVFERDKTHPSAGFGIGMESLAILDKNQFPALPRPMLISRGRFPIGLPSAYQEVWQEFHGFLPWLDARLKADWETIVVDSIANQSQRSPFVVCKKGEKKLGDVSLYGNAKNSPKE